MAWTEHRDAMLASTTAARAAAKANPETVARMRAWSRSPANPIYDPIVRAKAVAVARERECLKKIRGGNGAPMPVPQLLLASRLCWTTEYKATNPVKQRRKRADPMRGDNRKSRQFYMLDIAEPTLKIALEVDGHSHSTKARRQSDARKDAALTAWGWRVLRFTNRRVMTDLETVVAEVMACVSSTSRPKPATTSPMGS